MSQNLPTTPAEVLDIVNEQLKTEIQKSLLAQQNSGFWKTPRKETATLLEEMTMEDMVDWVCKSVKPVTQTETGERPEDILMLDSSILKLPTGFKKTTSIEFAAAGDLLYADGLELSKDLLFENISDLLFDKTVSYANFESPVTTQELVKEVISDQSAPLECCNKAQFNILTNYKGKHFTIMNTANNHMLDMGIEGIETTLQTCSEQEILAVGTNETPEKAKQGITLEANNIKLGFVSYTFGLNGHQLPDGENYRINTSNLLSKYAEPKLEPIKAQIEDCKNKGCDFVIASMHWGFEFELFPRNRQIKAAHELVESGADAVLCHHPHVIQPIEYYRTKRDPNRVATIAYSLGSLTWGFTAPHLVLSLIQELKLTKGIFEGKNTAYIEEHKVTPVFRSVINDGEKNISTIEKLADHLDGKSNRHSKEYILNIKRYAELVLGSFDNISRTIISPTRHKLQKL